MKLVTQPALAEVAMNAARYVWLRENWRSEVDGERVPEWIGRLLLHYGGFDKCVDLLMTTASHAEPMKQPTTGELLLRSLRVIEDLRPDSDLLIVRDLKERLDNCHHETIVECRSGPMCADCGKLQPVA